MVFVYSLVIKCLIMSIMLEMQKIYAERTKKNPIANKNLVGSSNN